MPGRLLALTPGTLRDGAGAAALERAVGAAFEAGLGSVLVREPGLSDRRLLALTRRLLAIAPAATDVWVGVHDRLHVALAAGAHGVHLGHRSLRPARARVVADGRLSVGFSAHETDEAEARVGADYLFFGPVHDTPSKRGLLEPTGQAALARCARGFEGPVWGIGGMRPDRLGAVLETGARGVAVLSDLLGSERPAERTRAWVEELACRG